MKLLIEVQCFNRKPITEITLNQLKNFKYEADIQIINDHSTEYDNQWLEQFGKVIQYPEKATINQLKYRSFKNFLNSDYDYFYMTDNDAFHDPDYINQLKKLNNECQGKIPITLYRSSFIKKCNAFKTIGDTKYGELRQGLFGGISVFLNKNHIKAINEYLLTPTEEEWIKKTSFTAWDSQFQKLFHHKFLVPKQSYVEHFGLNGQNHKGKNDDYALEPTEYLAKESPEIWEKLINVYNKLT